jgi:uncharacterized protein (TIGR02246 family)
MTHRVSALGALLLAAAWSIACQASAAAGLSDADTTALKQNDQVFATSAMAKNFGAAAALYTDDASMMPPNGPAVQGRQQIEKFLSSFPPISSFTFDIVDVDGRGDLAYVRGNYAMTLTPPGGAPVNDRGKYVEIWRKQADGSWKIKWDIFNSDVAAPGQ